MVFRHLKNLPLLDFKNGEDTLNFVLYLILSVHIFPPMCRLRNLV